jgi:hypothetical protein
LRVPRATPATPGAAKSEQLLIYQRALKAYAQDGGVSDPALRKRILAGWHPGIELSIMTTKPDLPDLIKATCFKILLDYTETPKAKLDAQREPGDITVTVVVPEWAAGPHTKAALPAPKEKIIDDDTFTV